MKQVRKQIYCSHCGDQISAEEQALLKDTLCALCDNMRLEAEEILRDRRMLKAIKPRIRLIHPVQINPR